MTIATEAGPQLTDLLPSTPLIHPEPIFDQTVADLAAHPLFGLAPFNPPPAGTSPPGGKDPDPLPDDSDEEPEEDPALDQAGAEPAAGEPDGDPDEGQEQRARDMLGRWTRGKDALGGIDEESGEAIGAPEPIESDPALALDAADDAPASTSADAGEPAGEGDTAVQDLSGGSEPE